jgi:uncharacterized membrane protein (DUF373 family)
MPSSGDTAARQRIRLGAIQSRRGIGIKSSLDVRGFSAVRPLEWHHMLKSLKYFQQFIVGILAAMIALVILLATADVVLDLFKDIVFNPPRYLIGVDELLGIFGHFLIILLGFELLETVMAYLRDDVIHVEVVLIVALIALARKVIVLEASTVSGLTMIGVGFLILSIAASYWLVVEMLRGGRARIEPMKTVSGDSARGIP